MTDQQRAKNTQLAIYILAQYDNIIGSENKFDFNKIREQLLSETDKEFAETLSIILLLQDLVLKHIEVREIIKNVNTYKDNYIKNKFLGGLN